MADPGRMFASAQQALASGNAAEALRQLDSLDRLIAPEPNVAHMRALACKQLGRLDEACNAFETARRLAPRDPQIANNYANLLNQMGQSEAALVLYDQAIAMRPDYRDARFNKALLLQLLGRQEEGLALLEELCAADPRDARAQSARGATLRALHRQDAAATAFDLALGAQPGLATALKGRAQVALERGEQEAPLSFRRALSVDPSDLALVLGLAEALEADGDPGGIGLVRAQLETHPDWVEGHKLLARMLAEAGDPDFTAEFRAAVARQPNHRALRIALADTFASAELWRDAYEALGPLAADADLLAARAHYRSEAGEPAEALRLLESQGPDASPPLQIALGRMAIRTGDLARAARVLQQAVAADPGNVAGWSQLELVWRALEDRRAHWLSGQEGLWSVQSIGLSEREIDEAASTLRALHRTRAQPIGQSVRGGTQTRGRLFLRTEPIIRRLHGALTAAVARHMAQLPPADSAHPLLRHREQAMRIEGSWSVRLMAQGFHANHIHPAGVLSSACYLASPPYIATGDPEAGWLELGRPPADLGLALEPIALIRPEPGRLALFPSYLYHGTRPFAGGERLTVAFDVVAA